jgi:hypothetical protein
MRFAGRRRREVPRRWRAWAAHGGLRGPWAPGERAVYDPGDYGAFVLDPDGRNIEVVNHNGD